MTRQLPLLLTATATATATAWLSLIATTTTTTGAHAADDLFLSLNQSDVVRNLPGLSLLAKKPRMLAGYIPVDGEGRELFYWFVESEKGLAAPLVLWTNGGPGCSGMLGGFTEQGPFRPTGDGKLEPNPYSWHKLANIVFIEQPVGVGFSKTKSRAEPYADLNAARDNYRFVLNFFNKYPTLRSQPFYVSSESYGGHYGPTLAKQIVDRGGVPNFRGILIGNPLTSGPMRDAGEFLTFAGHQLLPHPLVEQFMSANCRTDPRQAVCEKYMAEARGLTQGLDPYGLDYPACRVRAEKLALLGKLGLVRTVKNPPPSQPLVVLDKDGSDNDDDHNNAASSRRHRRRQLQYFPPKYDECAEAHLTSYLNRRDVQSALNVQDQKVPWAPCNDWINTVWNRTDPEISMVPTWKYLIEKGNGIKLWIFSGDDDSVCATAQEQMWIWSSGLTATSKWEPWHVDAQVAGYSVRFKGLEFYTVHGGGHMVPTTRPHFALELFRRFLAA